MRPSDYDQEELFMMLEPTLTMVAAGRTDGHRCPVCERADLDCEEDAGQVKVRCPQCGLFFKGMLG
ncbi:MAG: hypothetical protein EXR79_07230 [Myxococcales bacterium]|nr:hypothetical protein [Myxococcales bacterium]